MKTKEKKVLDTLFNEYYPHLKHKLLKNKVTVKNVELALWLLDYITEEDKENKEYLNDKSEIDEYMKGFPRYSFDEAAAILDKIPDTSAFIGRSIMLIAIQMKTIVQVAGKEKLAHLLKNGGVFLKDHFDIGKMLEYLEMKEWDKSWGNKWTEIHDKLAELCAFKKTKPIEYRYPSDFIEYIKKKGLTLPSSNIQLAKWSRDMHNCMASYHDKIVHSTSFIAVKLDDEGKALYAFEFSNSSTPKLLQAKSRYNKEISKKEMAQYV